MNRDDELGAGAELQVGPELHRWASELWPICRSITGSGVRETLAYLKERLPSLTLHEVPSGTRAFDWTVPDEWNIRDAFVADLAGDRVVDFQANNLHVVGYSTPVDGIMSRNELEPHLHSNPDKPDAIPYVTSYYERYWGFCVSEVQRQELGAGPFKVRVDSDLSAGHLTYADTLIPGETDDEVLLSTYVCHPSMANNELSGPVVTTAIGRWLLSLPRRRYSYRLVFVPETIGAIVYLAAHLDHLRKHVKAGWVVTCVGDERAHSFVPSRLGGTIADKVSLQVLAEIAPGFAEYTFLDRGSDERQYCAPGVDLPVCSVMRSKYGMYPEYHTSLDDLSLVTARGLQGGFDALRRCIEVLEANRSWQAVFPGEPQLSSRGLYPALSERGSSDGAKTLMNVLAYCDGGHDVIDLCRRTGASTSEVLAALGILKEAGLVVEG